MTLVLTAFFLSLNTHPIPGLCLEMAPIIEEAVEDGTLTQKEADRFLHNCLTRYQNPSHE